MIRLYWTPINITKRCHFPSPSVAQKTFQSKSSVSRNRALPSHKQQLNSCHVPMKPTQIPNRSKRNEQATTTSDINKYFMAFHSPPFLGTWRFDIMAASLLYIDSMKASRGLCVTWLSCYRHGGSGWWGLGLYSCCNRTGLTGHPGNCPITLRPTGCPGQEWRAQGPETCGWPERESRGGRPEAEEEESGSRMAGVRPYRSWKTRGGPCALMPFGRDSLCSSSLFSSSSCFFGFLLSSWSFSAWARRIWYVFLWLWKESRNSSRDTWPSMNLSSNSCEGQMTNKQVLEDRKSSRIHNKCDADTNIPFLTHRLPRQMSKPSCIKKVISIWSFKMTLMVESHAVQLIKSFKEITSNI